MKNRFLNCLLAASLLAFHLPALADDIDLFMGVPPSPTDLPNLMLVLDNAANFSSSADATNSTCTIGGANNSLSGTVGGIEQCALYNVISAIPTSSPTNASVTAVVNVGIMVYNANNIRDINNANCGGSNGGCLAQPLVPLTAANKTALLAWIKSWHTSGGAGSGYIKASGEATAASIQETWAYLYGRTGLSGRSYASIRPTLGCHTYLAFIGNSYSSSGSPSDSSPAGLGPKNALNGAITSNTDMNANPPATADQTATITSTLQTSCGTYTFPSSNHETGGFYADEWTRYMYLTGQNVRTYTIGVLGGSCQANYAALLTSMAAVGKGKYFPTTDYSSLVFALQTILGEIQSFNTAFAAVSLPVSVNTQGTYLNQVFVGMFRPDQNALPRWNGNLKQYKLGLLNGTLQLLDADDRPAISSNGSGFIDECARSFWTPPTGSPDTYWWFNPQGTCPTNPNTSNTPDGSIVEKGGQGYQLRGGSNYVGTYYGNRTAYTCSSTSITSCTSLISFDTNLSPTVFGLSSSDTTTRDLLVKWEKGKNNHNTTTTDPDFNTTYSIRPSVHGDVVHSRPVAINYGTTTSPQVVVFYGGNDGILRAVNGDRDGGATIGSASPGQELWSFVAPEFTLNGNVQSIRNDNVPVSYYGNLSATTTQPKPYGFDGPVTAVRNSGHTWIYATMRRGGSSLYAFNVDDPTNPSLKWKVGCDSTGCTNGFSNSTSGTIGQTWSSPKMLKAQGYQSGNAPLLVMGGGYDTCEDSDTTACTTPAKGSQIYVLDADTGALQATLPLRTVLPQTGRGVISDVFVVPDPVTGLAKYAYVGDLGGNIWRVNIGTDTPSNWTVTQIASLGCDTVTSCFANRKFEFIPDVVLDNGKYDLLIGSGDREKPLASYTNAYAVNNYFFMVQDDPSDSTWLSSESSNCGGNSVICLNSLVEVPLSGASPTPATVSLHKGWYLQLNPHEQVVTSALTIYGTASFSTHTPAVYQPGQCTGSLGTARVYNISYVNAAGVWGDPTSRSSVIDGGGLAPSPVGGMVTLDNGTTVPFCIGCNPQSALQGGSPPPPPPLSQPKSRVYWQIER